ncbi:unnamed protein product [Lota lota]
MEEADSDPLDAGARSYWEEADVDGVFNRVCEYLEQLRCSLKSKTATYTDYVQGLRLVRLVEAGRIPGTPDSSSIHDVIIAGVLPTLVSSQEEVGEVEEAEEAAPSAPLSPLLLHSDVLVLPLAPPSAGQEEPEEALYQPHQCTKACLPSLPRTSQPFWGQNPLKVPLLCGFKRLGEQEVTSEELPYITPCGLRLHSHEDVMRFLFSTESYDVLQVEFFTFNAAVRLNPPLAAGPRLPELDLSRGLEPTPVELCPGEAGTRPQDFRYRKDRWPHGCFLSASPALFHTCCDCLDGCLDALRCACRGRSSRGPHYTHHNLPRPLEAGLLECGPWCGCDRARCQNRLVQQGVRVRLQVFQNTTRGGWGVRCRDDLDQGTFICTYAGLVLRKGRDSEEAPPPNRLGAEPSSDDDVEVVTEWLVPPGTDGVPPTSALLHVPVIQRPSEPPHLSPPITPQQTQNQETQTQQTQTQETETQNQETKTQPNQTQETQETQETQNQESHRVRAQPVRKRKREEDEDVYYLDATKEGNVARFLNQSCRPNLFTQSVFTDTQDPGFPIVAFFTSRVIKAGTELTWKCSPDTGSASPGQEVACQCGNEDCEGVTNCDQAMCEVCDVHENVHENVQKA